MPRSSGTYTPPASSWNPTTSGASATKADWDALLADLTAAMTQSISRDGQSPVTANLPMASFKLTGLSAGTVAGDSVRFEQVGALALAQGAAASGANIDITSLLGSASALALISTSTAAASATIDFTSGITSTYDEYLITVTDLTPATDGTSLLLQFSEDAGASFKAGATDYAFTQNILVGAGAPSNGGSTASTSITLATSLSNAGTASGEFRVFKPSGTARHKIMTGLFGGEASGATPIVQWGTTGVFKLDNNAINGIRLKMSSGNITNGTFAIYGVRKV